MPDPLPLRMQNRRGRAKPVKRQTRLIDTTHLHPQFTKLQVVTTFSSDSTTPSIKIRTQSRTYVFNCGEGMQRLSQTYGQIPKQSDIFLTRLDWDVAGGLPGTKIDERI
jgi:tRNase Z endonuclease